ncbi:Type-1 restriction enzyme MjaXIP specificity protein [ANME-1 cluster archaeon GoMg2]|nr:Type-1 restriction enzyme MjaXIP specificity protein [ANME-1 cluster archaeon GoMg2]
MSEWKECKLGELGTVVTGKTPSKNNPEDWGDAMPFITPSDYKYYGKMASRSERNLSIVGVDRLSNKVLPVNSILVTCIGSDMGKVAMNQIKVITNQQINSIIPDVDIVNNNFLYYRLVDMYKTLRIYGGDGTAVPIVNKGDFESIETEIPPLPEQRAIASVLSSLDDKIDLLHRQNKTLEAMAETLFRQWFVEGVEEGWEERPLSFYGNIICGKTPSKKVQNYFNGDTPFIKIPDMHGNVFLFDTADSLTDAGKLSQPNKTLPSKSICVSCIATVGLVSFNAKESQTNQQINSIVPHEEYYRYYLYLTMRSSYDLLHAMASGGTATLNLNTGDFSKIPVLYPDQSVLETFHREIKPLFDKIFFNQSQIRTLEKLRDNLLPKLMSGEVRVKFEQQEAGT